MYLIRVIVVKKKKNLPTYATVLIYYSISQCVTLYGNLMNFLLIGYNWWLLLRFVCKVYNWFLSWWHSLVYWNFCPTLCTSGLQRKSWICCMHSSCKYICCPVSRFSLAWECSLITFFAFIYDSMQWYWLLQILLLLVLYIFWDQPYFFKWEIYVYFLNL